MLNAGLALFGARGFAVYGVKSTRLHGFGSAGCWLSIRSHPESDPGANGGVAFGGPEPTELELSRGENGRELLTQRILARVPLTRRRLLRRVLVNRDTEEVADHGLCPAAARDPDFAHLTYGDNGVRRGRGLADFDGGDVVAFFAGLRPVRAWRALSCTHSSACIEFGTSCSWRPCRPIPGAITRTRVVRSTEENLPLASVCAPPATGPPGWRV